MIGQDGFANPFLSDKVPGGWEVRSIESLCSRVTSGGTPSRSNPAFYEKGNVRWYKTKELNDWYLEDSEEKITAEAVKNSSAKIFPANTVLMAMYGDGDTITTLGILREEAATNQACCAMIVNPDMCHHEYLLYALKYNRNAFIQIATGGAQRNLSGRLIRNFAIQVPPIPIQRRIAEILGRLDDKIEVNRRINRTLEAMAQALYKHWFVDFGPFQDGAFVESELGLIPQGWRVGEMEDLFLLQRGFDLPAPARTPGKYPVMAASGFNGNHAECKVKGPGVVTGRSGVLGKVFYVPDDFWPLNTTLWIREFRVSRPLHAYHFLQNFDLLSFNSGSAVPTLNRNDIHHIPVIVPTPEVVALFEKKVGNWFALIHQNEQEMQKLTEIRDYLLPKLLSGEISVEAAAVEALATSGNDNQQILEAVKHPLK